MLNSLIQNPGKSVHKNNTTQYHTCGISSFFVWFWCVVRLTVPCFKLSCNADVNPQHCSIFPWPLFRSSPLRPSILASCASMSKMSGTWVLGLRVSGKSAWGLWLAWLGDFSLRASMLSMPLSSPCAPEFGERPGCFSEMSGCFRSGVLHLSGSGGLSLRGGGSDKVCCE